MAWKKYRFGTRFYDALSGERAVYRAGRVAGIELMGLRAGDTVLDLGCGTGLSFELLVNAVGPTGQVIGVDASPQMLRVAARRVVRNGWSNVRVIRVDATQLSSEDLAVDGLTLQIDAVFSAYALSVMGNHHTVLERAKSLLVSGGRVGIVDMQRPVGVAAIFTPLAVLACALGGADIDAHPWEWLRQRAHDVRQTSRRGGHIQAVTGTLKCA